MGSPAAVAGDQIMGTCVGHQTISPSGSPMPAPPMPFMAPLTTGLVSSVLITGKPAAVVGSGGTNTSPHVALHSSDPFLVPTQQKGTVMSGSTSVLIGGTAAATSTSNCTMCLGPASSLMATAQTVLIG